MPLGLQDAIALAMENSMDIAVQRYSPWMADVSLLKAGPGCTATGRQEASRWNHGEPAVAAVRPIHYANCQLSDAAIPIANPFTSGTAGTGASYQSKYGAATFFAPGTIQHIVSAELRDGNDR